MSPMAYTPGSPVRQNSSTSMKPRSVTFTAVPDRPSLSANGRRPTLTTTASTSRLSTSLPSPPTSARRCRPLSVGVWPSTFTLGADVDVLLLEAAHDDVGDVGVEAGKDLGQPLEDRHLGTEVGEGAGELAPDGPAADHHDAAPARDRASAPRRWSSPGLAGSKPGMVRGTEPAASTHVLAADGRRAVGARHA